VLVEIKASGVCHTDEFTRSGGDPEGLFPVIFGHEGAGVVVDVGPGIVSLKKGDHVIPLYTPECRACKSCLSGKTNLCTAIRTTQGQGVMPTAPRAFAQGQEDPPLHGCSTFSNYTVLPEIALAKIRPDAPFDKVCYNRLRRHHRHRRGDQHRQGRAGRNVVVFGWAASALNVLQGARMVGANMIVVSDLTRRARRSGRKFGIPISSTRRTLEGKDLVAHIVELTDGGADYSFECVGNTRLMRQALECGHRGWANR